MGGDTAPAFGRVARLMDVASRSSPQSCARWAPCCSNGRRARRPTRTRPASGSMLQLARRPDWLAGIASDIGGLACQAAALSGGRLVVVQPVLAANLVFALPIGAWFEHRRVARREFAGAMTVLAGMVVFLVIADPGGGRADATGQAGSSRSRPAPSSARRSSRSPPEARPSARRHARRGGRICSGSRRR